MYAWRRRAPRTSERGVRQAAQFRLLQPAETERVRPVWRHRATPALQRPQVSENFDDEPEPDRAERIIRRSPRSSAINAPVSSVTPDVEVGARVLPTSSPAALARHALQSNQYDLLRKDRRRQKSWRYGYTISIQFQKIDNIFPVTKSAVPVSIWRLSFLSKVSLIAI